MKTKTVVLYVVSWSWNMTSHDGSNVTKSKRYRQLLLKKIAILQNSIPWTQNITDIMSVKTRNKIGNFKSF